MDTSDVTAVFVTRGDCDIAPVLDSLIFGDVKVWNNSKLPDKGAFGRYLAAGTVLSPLVYFQDDDCLVPEEDQRRLLDSYEEGVLSALMPPERTDYTDTVLIGWGSLCDRDLPWDAFNRWQINGYSTDTQEFMVVGADFVFPMLVPWKRLDGSHTDLPHAHAPNRTWASWPDYAAVKDRYLTEGRRIRDRS